MFTHVFKSRSKKLQHTCSKRGGAVKGRLNNVKKNCTIGIRRLPKEFKLFQDTIISYDTTISGEIDSY